MTTAAANPITDAMTADQARRYRMMKAAGKTSIDAHDGFIAAINGDDENPFSIVENVIRNRQWANGRYYATANF